MMSSLWISKTGLAAQDQQLRTISNNLSNASTVGFKRDRIVFEDLLYQIERQPGAQSSENSQLPSGMQLGTGVRAVATQKVFKEGSYQVTNESLDMAINGRGFFAVTMPDGGTTYTRNGQFSMDSNGQIVNSDGYALQPGINIPENAHTVTIGIDGIVSANVFGESAPQEVGQINIVDFVNPGGLEAIGGNLFSETASSGSPQEGTPGIDGLGQIRQGVLENSNVDVVEELVNMITTQRAYEMNSKVISSADQMLQFLNQNV